MDELDDRDGPGDPDPDRQPRSPYRTPTLRVLGPVALLTNSFSRAGVSKDGGPNNTKT